MERIARRPRRNLLLHHRSEVLWYEIVFSLAEDADKICATSIQTPQEHTGRQIIQQLALTYDSDPNHYIASSELEVGSGDDTESPINWIRPS